MENLAMIDKQTLISMIDELPEDELEELYHYIKIRRQLLAFHGAEPHWDIEPIYQKPAEIIRDEVNALIDDAIDQAKRNREKEELANHDS